jgi:hypothetical protein
VRLEAWLAEPISCRVVKFPAREAFKKALAFDPTTGALVLLTK